MEMDSSIDSTDALIDGMQASNSAESPINPAQNQKSKSKSKKFVLIAFLLIIFVVVTLVVAGFYFINQSAIGGVNHKTGSGQHQYTDQSSALLNLSKPMGPIKTKPVTPASIKEKVIHQQALLGSGASQMGSDNKLKSDSNISLPNPKSNQTAILNLQKMVATIGAKQDRQQQDNQAIQQKVSKIITQLDQLHKSGPNPQQYVAVHNELVHLQKQLKLLNRKIAVMKVKEKVRSYKSKKAIKPPFKIESTGIWNNRRNVFVSMNSMLKVLYVNDSFKGWKIISIDVAGQKVTVSNPNLKRPVTLQVGE